MWAASTATLTSTVTITTATVTAITTITTPVIIDLRVTAGDLVAVGFLICPHRRTLGLKMLFQRAVTPMTAAVRNFAR